MQISSRTLTSSEILNLSTTPIEIVSAQGSGLYIVPCFILLRSKTGTTPYTGSASFNLVCNSINLLTSGLSLSNLNQSVDSVSYFPLQLVNGFELSDLDNQSLSIQITSGSLSAGDGELEVLTTYEIYNV